MKGPAEVTAAGALALTEALSPIGAIPGHDGRGWRDGPVSLLSRAPSAGGWATPNSHFAGVAIEVVSNLTSMNRQLLQRTLP